jgi:hypothetical protein
MRPMLFLNYTILESNTLFHALAYRDEEEYSVPYASVCSSSMHAARCGWNPIDAYTDSIREHAPTCENRLTRTVAKI